MEKRYKRRKFLYHRFIMRHFNILYAKEYFDKMVREKRLRPTGEEPAESFMRYLIWLLQDSHGLSVSNKDSKYMHVSYEFDEYLRDYDRSQIDMSWEDIRKSHKYEISRRYSIHGNINKLFYDKYIGLPVENKKYIMGYRTKENTKVYSVLCDLLGILDDADKLLIEMDRRIGVNRKGRRVIMEICPPDITADFEVRGRLQEPEKEKISSIICAIKENPAF
jgi:hypothetical protein